MRHEIALQYVRQQEEAIDSRAHEVEFLSGIGINAVDTTLRADHNYIEMIPQYQRIAQFCWNQLCNITDHPKLTSAISRQLKENYDNY